MCIYLVGSMELARLMDRGTRLPLLSSHPTELGTTVSADPSDESVTEA